MTVHNQTYPTTRLYRILVALIVPCFIYYIVSTISFVISPLPVIITGEIPSRATIILQLFCLLPLTTLTGLLIIRRVPGNVVGPLIVLMGTTVSSSGATLGSSGLLQGMTQFFNQSNIAIFFLLLFYFPTGKANIVRLERPILIATVAAPIFAFFNLLTTSHLNPNTMNTPNPLFIAALAPYYVNLFPVFFIPSFICLFSLFWRYRIASQHEKQQIKWFVLCVSTFIPIFIGWMLALNPSIGFDSLFGKVLLFVSSTWFYAVVPLGVSLGILRHRLYDIDIIIRRTLIYSVLTGILAVVYFGGVVVTQQLFQAVTGETPDIAIVLSTLLIAALFNPLRRRIQDVIDRRLYRRKYDVEKTIAQFNQSLRDEVDVKTLQTNLISVVSDTMQPDKIALWVKE